MSSSTRFAGNCAGVFELTIDHKAGAGYHSHSMTGGFVDKGRPGSLAGRALETPSQKRQESKERSLVGTEEALIPDPDVVSFVPRRCGNGEEDDHFIICLTACGTS